MSSRQLTQGFSAGPLGVAVNVPTLAISTCMLLSRWLPGSRVSQDSLGLEYWVTTSTLATPWNIGRVPMTADGKGEVMERWISAQ
ncbi:MAG: hypothetical protein E6R15_01500 [Zoogloea sp.]|nr:MAG: hypothetical protein E6R15_01500 [Zoogloea sp.]